MSRSITDADVLEYIARVQPLSSDQAAESVAEPRAIYNQRSAALRHPLPDGDSVQDDMIVGDEGVIPIRRYFYREPAVVHVLYWHGGGFVLGSLESHNYRCAELAQARGTERVAVEYRLAREHPHPAQLHDALTAADTLGDRPLIACGVSAGGNLAAAVAQARPNRISGQTLIYPMLGGSRLGMASYEQRDELLLTTNAIHVYNRHRMNGAREPNVPAFSPLWAKSYGSTTSFHFCRSV